MYMRIAVARIVDRATADATIGYVDGVVCMCGYVCTWVCMILGKNGYACIRVHVSLVRVRTLRHTCPYASTRRRFARVSG